MKEIWKDIPTYEGLYQISNKGKVKNIGRNKIKKQTINKDGYYVVKLSKNNKKKVCLVHRLIAETFLNYNDYKYVEKDYGETLEKGDLVVNHKDENKLNNDINNLEWCTNRYNINYSLKNNTNSIKNKLYEYMKTKNIDNDTINIIMQFFKYKKDRRL